MARRTHLRPSQISQCISAALFLLGAAGMRWLMAFGCLMHIFSRLLSILVVVFRNVGTVYRNPHLKYLYNALLAMDERVRIARALLARVPLTILETYQLTRLQPHTELVIIGPPVPEIQKVGVHVRTCTSSRSLKPLS